jgi:hypothetical protein
LTGNEERAREIRLVHVEHVIDRDLTVGALADLPLGWKAWRQAPEDQWTREPIPHDQPELED